MKCDTYDRLTLLSYVSGDCSEERKETIRSHLEGCSVCADFVKSAEEEREQFLCEFPSINVVTEPDKKLLRFRPMVTALSIAAVLVLAIGVGNLIMRQPVDGYRTKGTEVALRLFVSDTVGQPVEPDDFIFTPGERIQFTYSCSKERYLILASIDETKQISVFYPMEGDRSMPLEPGIGLPLPHSIQLDDYIGKELFCAVFSARPLQVAAVVDKLAQVTEGKNNLEKVSLSIDGAVIRSILLTKKEYQR